MEKKKKTEPTPPIRSRATGYSMLIHLRSLKVSEKFVRSQERNGFIVSLSMIFERLQKQLSVL